MSGTVATCEACGRLVAGVFPMHRCLTEEETRYSICPALPPKDEEYNPQGPAVAKAMTLEGARAWLRIHPDPEHYRVTRWEHDPEDPFGLAQSTGNASGEDFLEDGDAAFGDVW